MYDFSICHVCHTQYKHEDDEYCRHCGSKRITENQCKDCGLQVDVDDLFCHHCGGETTTYDLLKK